MPDFFHGFARAGTMRALAGAAFVVLAGCGGDDSGRKWRSLGQVPTLAATALNHTPLVVSGGRALVGTADGIWARQLDGSGGWSGAGLGGVSIFATRKHPELDATVFAAGMPVDAADAPPFYRSDDGGYTWIASANFPRNPFDQSS